MKNKSKLFFIILVLIGIILGINNISFAESEIEANIKVFQNDDSLVRNTYPNNYGKLGQPYPAQTYTFIDENGKFNMVYRSKNKVYWSRLGTNNEIENTVSWDMYFNMYTEGLTSSQLSLSEAVTDNFGGAIYYNNYLYVLYARKVQKSTADETNEEPALAIVIYNKNGDIVKSQEYKGIDINPSSYLDYGTQIPFYGPTDCDMGIVNDRLIIFFGRNMFYPHQTSYLMVVDATSLEHIDNPNARPSHSEWGTYYYLWNHYISHSLAQRIMVTSEGDVITAEFGDASQRGLYLNKFIYGLDTEYNIYSFKPHLRRMFHFREGTNSSNGYNLLYNALGNLIEVDDGYIYIGAMEKSLSQAYAHGSVNEEWNLFIQKYPKDFYDTDKYTDETMQLLDGEQRVVVDEKSEKDIGRLYLKGDEIDYGFKWLTDLDGKAVQLVRGVKLDDNYIAILWEESNLTYNEKYENYSFSSDSTMYCMIIDKNGNVIRNKTEVINGKMSNDIHYTSDNGIIKWITTGSSKNVTYYELDIKPVEVISIKLNTTNYFIKTGETVNLGNELVFNPENCTNKNMIWSSSNESVATVDENGVVTAVGIGNNSTNGYAQITGKLQGTNLKVTASINVTRATHRVKFQVNGGYSISDRTVYHGDKLSNMPTPYRSQYTFLGWFIDEELTQEFDINTPIMNDMTLYAKWIRELTIVNASSQDFERPYYNEDVKTSFTFKISSLTGITLSLNNWAFNANDGVNIKSNVYNESKYGIGKFNAVLVLKVDDDYLSEYSFVNNIILKVNYEEWNLSEVSDDGKIAYFYSDAYETSDGISNCILLDGNTFDKFKNRTITDIQNKWEASKLLYTASDNIYERPQSLVAPYDGGLVKQDYLDNCIRLLNYYRYLVGNVEITNPTHQRDDLQKASVCQRLWLNQGHGLEHYLSRNFTKPDDMDDDFYNIVVTTAENNHNIISTANFTDPVFLFFRESYFYYTAGHRMALLGPTINSVDFGIGNRVIYGDTRSSKNVYNDMENLFGAYPSPGIFPYQDFGSGSDWDVYLNMNYFAYPNNYYETDHIRGTIENLNTNEIIDLNHDSENIAWEGNVIHIKNPKNSEYRIGDKYKVILYGLYNNDGKNVTITYIVNFVDKNEGLEANINSISMDQTDLPRFENTSNEFDRDLVWYLMNKEGTVWLDNGSRYDIRINKIKSYDIDSTADYYGFYDNKVNVEFDRLPNNIKDPNNYITNVSYKIRVATEDIRYFKDKNQEFEAQIGEDVTIDYEYYNTNHTENNHQHYRWIIKKPDGSLVEIENNDKYQINKNKLVVKNVTEEDLNDVFYFVFKEYSSAYCPKPSKIIKATEPIIVNPNISVKYQVKIKNEGNWKAWVKDGQTAMRETSGNLQQAMRIDLDNKDYDGDIVYSVHVENIGWMDEVKNGEIAGIENTSLRTEALKIRLTDELAEHYDIYYRTHVQNNGWMSWAKNGETSGSSGAGLRIEGIQIKIVKKDSGEPTYDEYEPDKSYPFHEQVNVIYMGHVENYGDVGKDYTIRNGGILGYPNRRLRIEGITIISESTTPGSIEYTTHVQNVGWLNEVDGRWNVSGEYSGRKGLGLRVEGIRIRLTDELATKFNIFYCVKVEDESGWQGWAKNGEEAGSMGFGKKLEAIRVVILPIGDINEKNYTPVPDPMIKKINN